MRRDWYEFETPYGPAYVVYMVAETREVEFTGPQNASFATALVKCPGHIVWDDGGNWYPKPEVVDYVLPRARAICDIVGVPAYEWLRELRRGDIWAIERDFDPDVPVSKMMDFYYEDDYDGRYSHHKDRGQRI